MVCIFKNWQHYSKLDKHEKNMDTCHNQYLFFKFCMTTLFLFSIYYFDLSLNYTHNKNTLMIFYETITYIYSCK